jgi:hypothetical protein
VSDLGSDVIRRGAIDVIHPTIMSTTNAAPASLASVVSIPERLGGWQRLDDKERLGELHAKFWGKMSEEETTWRAQHQPTSDTRETEDDESEDDGEAGYILKFENDAINMDEILVRVSVFKTDEVSTVLMDLVGIHADVRLPCGILRPVHIASEKEKVFKGTSSCGHRATGHR